MSYMIIQMNLHFPAGVTNLLYSIFHASCSQCIWAVFMISRSAETDIGKGKKGKAIPVTGPEGP
jgi:hypothetical protein